MRLIDADKIIIRLPFTLPPYNMMLLRNSIRQGIQDTPTVEAIPVEWLLKWAEDRYFLMATSDDYHLSKTYYSPMFKDAIKDWREEQSND